MKAAFQGRFQILETYPRTRFKTSRISRSSSNEVGAPKFNGENYEVEGTKPLCKICEKVILVFFGSREKPNITSISDLVICPKTLVLKEVNS